MPRTNKQPQSKSKATSITSSKAIVKKKQIKSSTPTTKNNHVMTMTRKQLIKSLAEIGVLTPNVIKIDMLRLLYEANINEGEKKHDSNLSASSTRFKYQNDKHAEMVTCSAGEETETAQDLFISSEILRNEEAQVNDSDNDIEESDEEGQGNLELFPWNSKQNKLGDNLKQVKKPKNVNSTAGKMFTLFSTPTAEERLTIGNGGLVERGDSDLETVPKGLRKAAIEGYNINLVRLLIPRDNKKYSRDDDEDEDRSIYLKQKSDPRLDKNLTILEFILAFTRYINIVCEAFPQRRRELTAYMSDIIRLSSRFGHPFFYDYHRLFAQKAETMLQTRNILVDWSKRDHDIYFNVFSGLRPVVCELCRSPDHTTYFCKKILERTDLIEKMLSNNPGRGLDTTSSLLYSSRRASGGDDIKQDFRPTCKFYNGAGFGKCVQPECRFVHLCSRCRGSHPKKLLNICFINVLLVATTPIDVDQLEKKLANHPDKKFTSFLVTGLREGFDTGISSIPDKSFECPNLRSARRDPDNVTRLVDEELNKGFLIGPYSAPPFDNYRINPIGVVESKYSKKKRIIVDLSAPRNNTEHPSINSLIDKETYSLTYVTVDDAIKRIQELGCGAWMNKADIQDAFKLLPIKPSLWRFYGIKWNNNYYFFVRLPFGSRSSPKLFDLLSEAIVWIAEHNYGITKMLHLLDDFFVVDTNDDGGERTRAIISLIFNRLKVPLSLKKTIGPVQEIEYLGIILDSTRMEARLPQEKVSRIIEMIKTLLNRRKCKKRELLSILGHMSFASRVVIPGRSFVHYLFNLTTHVRSLESHITINRQAQLELEMWHRHLSEWNGTFFFLDPKITTSTDLALSTDASTTIGCGAVFGDEWFAHKWSEQMLNLPVNEKSTALFELIPIVIAAVIWGNRWERKRICLLCDNQATVNIVNKGRSKSSFIMAFSRKLTLLAMQHHFLLKAVYISTTDNVTADALSRLQMTRFRQQLPSADCYPRDVPQMTELTFPSIESITL